MESENRYDPAIDARARSQVGIIQHAFNVTGVDFHNEIPNANEIQAEIAKRSK
jgi:hypothetical protein